MFVQRDLGIGAKLKCPTVANQKCQTPVRHVDVGRSCYILPLADGCGAVAGELPSWLLSGAELVAVISLFGLMCFLESSSGNTDRSNPTT